MMLRTDVFTLLLTNLNDAEALYTEIDEKLAAWKQLIHSVRLSGHGEDETRFAEIFGTKPATVLVRPDGLCGVRG